MGFSYADALSCFPFRGKARRPEDDQGNGEPPCAMLLPCIFHGPLVKIVLNRAEVDGGVVQTFFEIRKSADMTLVMNNSGRAIGSAVHRPTCVAEAGFVFTQHGAADTCFAGIEPFPQ